MTLLSDNLHALIDLAGENILVRRRMRQLRTHIRQVSEKFMVETGPFPREKSLSRLRETYVQMFRLLRDLPNISDDQRLAEYQAQIHGLLASAGNIFEEIPGTAAFVTSYQTTSPA